MQQKIKDWLDRELPFVVYRKPNENERIGWFQQNDELRTAVELNASCFVFAPFHDDEKTVFLKDDCVLAYDDSDIVLDDVPSESTIENAIATADEDFHIQLVRLGINAIQKGCFKKVVLSRKEEVVVNRENYIVYFNRFLTKYPTAFVYWFYHPKVGMWMGASPEQLLKITNGVMQTVALAATQLNLDNNQGVNWTDKEQKEQQIVTDFIVESIAPFTKFLKVSQPYTHKAGALLHIKTDVEAQLIDPELTYKVTAALHPTPALCGYPKEAARKFILENERYDREYYGGYLGEWYCGGSNSKNCDLFVNLRCMKLVGAKAYLFLGGGVNADSVPIQEYRETVNKSKTVKSIL